VERRCEADVVSRSNLGGAVKEIPKKSGETLDKVGARNIYYLAIERKAKGFQSAWIGTDGENQTVQWRGVSPPFFYRGQGLGGDKSRPYE